MHNLVHTIGNDPNIQNKQHVSKQQYRIYLAYYEWIEYNFF